MANAEEASGARGIFRRSWIPPTVGALFLAILASALWDFLVKPGLAVFWSYVLAFLTFGSEAVQNSIYTSAALDPTHSPSLVMFMVLCGTPWFAIAAKKAVHDSRRRQKREDEEFSNLTEEELDVAISRRRKIIRVVFYGYFGLIGCLFLVASVHVSTSISVWREFHANLRICTPYLSQPQREGFVARFASMQTKSDYESLSKDFEAIASSNRVRLVNK